MPYFSYKIPNFSPKLALFFFYFVPKISPNFLSKSAGQPVNSNKAHLEIFIILALKPSKIEP